MGLHATETFQIDPARAERALEVLPTAQTHRWCAAKTGFRDTINYGWNFIALEQARWEWTDIPEPIAQIREALFWKVADKIQEGSSPEDFNNVIVSIYGPGDDVPPHVDREYFGKSILAVVVTPDPSGHLFFIHHEGEGKPAMDAPRILDVPERVGSALLMQGPLRHYPYFHAVTGVEEKRISLTFRTVKRSPEL